MLQRMYLLTDQGGKVAFDARGGSRFSAFSPRWLGPHSVGPQPVRTRVDVDCAQ